LAVRAQFPSNEGIFGQEKEISIKTVTVADKYFITYTKDKCSLKCINVRGDKQWELDLHKFECELIYFDKVKDGSVKGCDLVLQLKSKEVVLVRSGSGKAKRLTLAEFGKAAYH